MASQAVLELLVQMKDEASSGLSSIGSAIGSLGGIAGGVALAGVTAFGAAVVSGIGDAREAAQVMAQTQAVIKSTGGAAGVTADQIADMAGQLSAASGKSLFGDSDIQQGQNLLLTFTNIKETLPDATQTMVDLAQAMGTDVKGGAIQLGKALNDPIAGISALSRVGVTFDEKQKAVIKRLQESGDVAGAQRIILAELNKEFGGSAQAAADADGGWAQFNDRMGEAKETLGAAVLPLLNGLVSVLNSSVLPVVEAGAQAFADLVGAFQTGAEDGGGFIGGLTNALYSLDTISPVFDTIGDDILMLTDTLADAGPLSSEFGEAIGGIATQFGLTTAQADILERAVFAVQDFIGGLAATFTDASNPIEGFLNVLSQVSPTFDLLRGVIESVLPPLQEIVLAVFDTIATFIAENGDEIVAFVQTAWASIQEIIDTTLKIIQATIVPLLSGIASFIRNHGAEIQAVLRAAWDAISGVIGAALGLISGLLKTVLLVIQGDWRGAWEMLKTTSATFVQAIVDTVRKVMGDLQGVFKTIVDGIKTIWQGLISSASTIGSNIIDGIISGVRGAAGALMDTLSGIASDALQAAKDALGIASPSKLFAEGVGKPVMQGMILGMEGMIPALLSTIDQVGIAMINGLKKKTDKAIAEVEKITADLIKQAKSIGGQINDAIASGFSGEASIDRLLADNLDAITKFTGKLGMDVRNQLDDALRVASQFADPKQASEFYKLRSDQILELADLQDQLNQDLSKEDRARIEQQMALIKAAQEAEQKAFGAENAGKQGPIAELTAQLQALLSSTNLPGVFDNPVIAQLTAMLQQLQNASAAFNLPTGGLATAGPVTNRPDAPIMYNVTIQTAPGTTTQQAGDIARQLGNLAKSRRA